MTSGGPTHALGDLDPTFISIDWSKHRDKRVAYAATKPAEGPWQIRCCDAYEESRSGWTVREILTFAESQREPVIVGIDAVLGLPKAYAEAQSRYGDELTFLEWLRERGDSFFVINDTAGWKPEQPFYRVHKKKYPDAECGRVMRSVDRESGGNPMFAVSGIPGTVGHGTRALWQELHDLPEKLRNKLAIWPFDAEGADNLKDFVSKSARGARVVLLETYPAVAYGVALGKRQSCSGLRPERLAKTRQGVRTSATKSIRDWLGSSCVDCGDFELGAAQYNEDAFDAFMTAVAFTRCRIEDQPLWTTHTDRVEGGMLLW